MNQKISLIVLCGLPAAGKTTIALKVLKLFNAELTIDTNDVCKQSLESAAKTVDDFNDDDKPLLFCKHVSYDELMPEDVYRQYNDADKVSNCDEMSPWKWHRKMILACVEKDVGKICDKLASENEIEILQYLRLKYEQCSLIGRSVGQKNVRYIFLLDDNMFLSSMRYEVFQLARKYNIGFLQVYLNCTVDAAQRRNAARPGAVTPHTIQKMADKFEPPDSKNHWESSTLILDSEKVNYDELVKKILESADHPIPLLEENELGRAEDRVLCSQNVIHQADLILRQLITHNIKTFKAQSVPIKPDEMKSKAAELNTIKTQILEELKRGNVPMPHEIEDSACDASKNTDNPLYLLINKIFQTKL